MNKAFTKEDTSDTLIVVPPRAPLPPGVPNYVTARGLALLRSELAELDAERARLSGDRADDAERTRRLVIVDARRAELADRVASAQLVDPLRQSHDEVRFGATVTLRSDRDGVREERRLTIVGVDEAAPAEGRVAFLTPIARAVLGLRVGESTSLHTAAGDEELEVTAISYTLD
jgi:transcription elongation factor GreB